ncbi:phosphotransferase [Phytoactinopolyspora sp. XMNu-373]|uniref:Phosphotransferase n=1 Tax=Phytoactinopolyspora mesophila TaxID=2650750 RepID=A0A7K3MBU6_9ACTN|nr:phosphotransferase [Phytoactinopolyspora mesophila]
MPGAEGNPTSVLRHGDTVVRPAGPWTETVHALLRHLEDAGFSGSPRLVGDGYDQQGRSVVTYIEGHSVHPRAWTDEAIWHAGQMLRDLHRATASFRPPGEAIWHPWPFHDSGPESVISHRDAGPWHIVARDGLPVAFIDWETAGPTDRLDEIAATAWWNAQLHDDDLAERHELPDANARAAQLRHFVDGYGLATAERGDLVTRMIEYAIRDSAAEAVKAGVTPESSQAGAVWAIAWRARSAAWMRRHRSMLQAALAAS